MPNSFAYLVLGLWPVISLLLFRRLPVGRALLASIMLGYMFLPPPPTAFDLPLVPAFNKENLPSLVALLACIFLYGSRMRLLPRSRLARVLLAILVFLPIATTLANLDPVFYGTIGLPALGLKDAIALVFNQAMLVVPMILAMNFLKTESDHRDVVLAMFFAGLLYSLFMLVEIRLSPQLNIWIYGFFQHSFEQMMRSGGFRPIVFLYHGLWVAFFAMSAVAAGVILLRRDTKGNMLFYLLGAVYLGIVLILCKSFASMAYALLLIPIILLFPVRIQIRVALVFGLLALCYPVMKGADLVPEQAIVDRIANVDLERSRSLQFRLDNEKVLVDRAFERPWFGWGSWGRNQILDPITGVSQTVPDGRWVIAIGVFGWPGFLAEFGLLVMPLLLFWWVTRGMSGRVPAITAGLALLLGINLLDMLPNATLTPLTWVWAGALLGYGENFERKTHKLTSVM